MRQNKIKAALLCAVLLLAFAVTGAAQQKSEMNRAAGKFNQTLFYIDRLYLEDVDLNALVEKAIVAAVGELDPHSSYISAEDCRGSSRASASSSRSSGIP